MPTSPDQALINIENSGLVTQLREALEWQTATTEILDIIIRSPGNVDPVFDAILEKVISLGDAAHCILWSINGTAFRSAASRGLGDQTSESGLWTVRSDFLHVSFAVIRSSISLISAQTRQTSSPKPVKIFPDLTLWIRAALGRC